jgi:hypothetical protein
MLFVCLKILTNYMQFDGFLQSTDTVHVCKQDMEFIGSCEPTYLDSADMECTATLSASKTVEQGTDRQTSRSSTDTQSHTNTNGGEDSTQNEFNVGAEVTGHAKVGFGVAEAGISVTLKGGYRRQVCANLNE